MAKTRGRRSNSERDQNGEQAPEGFDIQISRQLGDGWALKQEGNIIQGRLMGRFELRGQNGKMRPVFQIKTVRPCLANVDTGGDELEEKELPAGSTINLDQTAALAELDQYVNNGGVYDVWIKFIAKEKTKNDNNFWRLDARIKMIKPPPRANARIPESEDDIPF